MLVKTVKLLCKNPLETGKIALNLNYSSLVKSPNIAFIGLGNMGGKMANNLVKKGRKLQVYDISPEARSHVKGVYKMCSSLAEAVRNSEVVITMLPNGDAVRQAILGDDGILENCPKSTLLIDCSTVEPKLCRDLSGIPHIRFIDAPVSGGITGAEAATLTFMVGGREEDANAARPILLEMGSKVLYCGTSGAGQIAKLCNNLILAVTMIATAEGMNLGVKMGLSPKMLSEIINVSSGRSWSSEIYNPVPGIIRNVPSSNDYEGGFTCKLMAKDLGLAEGMALDASVPVPFGAVAHQLYRTLIVNGYEQKDFSVIYQFLKGVEESVK